MSALYPGFEEWMRGQGYDFWNPGIDDTIGSGFWYSNVPDRDNGGWMMQEAPGGAYDDWASQYDTPYMRWMKALEGNPSAGKIGGTAGLVAPGYMGGIWDERMLRHSYSPDQLAARQAFQNQYSGYGQINPEHINFGPNGELSFKSAGAGVGDYIIDQNQIQFDPTYGYISPLSNLGHAGSKGGFSEALYDFAPLALMVAGGALLGESGLGAEAGMGGVGDVGVNLGGLDGALGDSIANYTAGMGNSGMSFFGDILGPLTDSQSWANDLGFLSGDGSIDWAAYDAADPAGLGNLGADVYGVGDGVTAPWYSSAADFNSALSNWGVNPQSAVKSLFGGGGSGGFGGGSSGFGGGSGGLLGSLLGGRSPVDIAATSAPFLAAINYAKNISPYDTSGLQNISAQYGGINSNSPFDINEFNTLASQVNGSPIDTSRLNDVYNQFDPSAVTLEFDQNTAAGRGRLAESLQARGVSGSSFGNNDMTSFNMARDMGRRNLINDSLAQRGAMASSIFGADVQNRNLFNSAIGQRAGLFGNMANVDSLYKNLGLSKLNAQTGIANNMLQAQIAARQQKNDLYGKALSGLGSALSPKQTIFG